MSFSENLNKLMEKNNIRGIDLAEGIGTSGTQVSAWRSGKKDPTYKNILKIVDFLDVPADMIFGRKQQIKLSDTELKLINVFRNLSDIDKGRLLERLDMMAEETVVEKIEHC